MMYMHDVFCDLWSFVGWYGTQQYIEIVNIDVGGLTGCCARSTIGRDIDWFQAHPELKYGLYNTPSTWYVPRVGGTFAIFG